MSDELQNTTPPSTEIVTNPVTIVPSISVETTLLKPESADIAFEPEEIVTDAEKRTEEYAALLKLPAYSPVATADSEVRNLFRDSVLAQALDAVQLTCVYPICGHLSLTPDKKLHVCRRKAGLNTTHEMVGRCFIHDPDGSFIEPASPFARHLSHIPSLQHLLADMQSSKSQFTALNQELAMGRTVLAAYLKKLNSSGRYTNRNQDTLANIMMALELIRKLAESAAKIQTLGSQQLTLDSVTQFLWKVQQIIEQEVLDPHTRLRIFDRIATEIQFETQ